MKNYDDMSRKAASIFYAQLTLNPRSVLGLATGSTPLGIYRQLIEWHRKGDLDFSDCVSINLDEYKDLPPEHPQSYFYFMRQNLFKHINIKPENSYLPDSMAEDAQRECARYDAVIEQSGGIDLQLLGLGHNGHIGFNEPGRFFEKGTHVVTLADSTIEANKRFFESIDDVPRQAITMGIRCIMQARRIVVAVSGEAKAEAVKACFQGPVTPEVPGSILQLHDNVTLVGDEEALSLLDL
jgi:glucosamine-6-phosphate deaminase